MWSSHTGCVIRGFYLRKCCLFKKGELVGALKKALIGAILAKGCEAGLAKL